MLIKKIVEDGIRRHFIAIMSNHGTTMTHFWLSHVRFPGSSTNTGCELQRVGSR